MQLFLVFALISFRFSWRLLDTHACTHTHIHNEAFIAAWSGRSAFSRDLKLLTWSWPIYTRLISIIIPLLYNTLHRFYSIFKIFVIFFICWSKASSAYLPFAQHQFPFIASTCQTVLTHNVKLLWALNAINHWARNRPCLYPSFNCPK